MNRYEKTAARIQRDTGVHVEWAPANREYVVDTEPCRDARQAHRVAFRKARELRPTLYISPSEKEARTFLEQHVRGTSEESDNV